MTFAELLLAACLGVFAYKILRPLQRMLESFFLRAIGGRQKPKIHVIDADFTPRGSRPKE